MAIINTIVNLGSSVMMPIIFFIVGLIFRMRPLKAFKAGMLVGVGFTGVSMVIDLMLNALGPASEAMLERLGLQLTVTDVGWGTASTIGWATPVMLITVIGFLVINATLLVLNITKTVNLDIFNYWIFLLVGAPIYAGTSNYWISIIAVWIIFIITLVVADITQPIIQKKFPNKDLSGLSFPHLTCLAWVPFGIVGNWICEHIPGIKKIKLDPETINSRFGILGEPISFGTIIGALMGILAGYDISNIMTLAVNIAAAMYLLPIVIDVLVSGLVMVKDHVTNKLKKWFPKRKFYIGMDTALLLDDPSVLSTGLLLLPITILLAFVLPGSRVLPFADLASLTFLFALVAPFCNRNIFRMLISGVLIVVVIFYTGTALAPEFTKAAVDSQITSVSSFEYITNLVGPVTTWIGWLFIRMSEWLAVLF
ncbi:MAG: PTS galactitol transporter subunit IIC [Tetragenococcus halophilus]|nr:PTS galactitol transporter subunit IIC [Tetragenococcus halophilus]